MKFLCFWFVVCWFSIRVAAQSPAGADSLRSINVVVRPSAPFDGAEMQPGMPYRLENLYFEMDRHTLIPQSQETLGKLYEFLVKNATLHVRLEGHVCCISGFADAYDLDTNEPSLSFNRAREVYRYLVGRGIDSSRLSYRGYGRSRPVVADEQTFADAAKNRRVEIRLDGD